MSATEHGVDLKVVILGAEHYLDMIIGGKVDSLTAKLANYTTNYEKSGREL